MNPWWIFAIVIVSIAAYIFVGSVIGCGLYAHNVDACEKCSRDAYCGDDHVMTAIMLGGFWPGLIFVAPLFAGAHIGFYFGESAQRKRAKIEKDKADYDEAVKLLREAGIELPSIPKVA